MVEISKSRLGIILSKLKGFEDPKVMAEQYIVDSEIASDVLWHALYAQRVSGCNMADLGCGTGILGIGALLLGAKKVYFVDNDKSSLDIAKSNYLHIKSESSLIRGKAIFVCQDVVDFDKKVDTVIMNPPFGVKVRHADKTFLEKAVQIAKTIYSFHKSESKGFISSFSKDNGFSLKETIDFSWPLKQTMGFHRRRIKRINVSCFVFEKI
ncbi:DNA methylase [Candidatus Woesearchaeota archaeon B3_Woes]|nr:MAG: DNA methylase [Candidatus Woesearchaeota archaeon B3_Woes]